MTVIRFWFLFTCSVHLFVCIFCYFISVALRGGGGLWVVGMAELSRIVQHSKCESDFRNDIFSLTRKLDIWGGTHIIFIEW